MIIARAPYRVSLAGGSSDYKSFYSRYGSLLVGFTINRYVYVALKHNEEIFDYKTRVAYSNIEMVGDNTHIQNPGVRGPLEYFEIEDGVSIHIVSDLPKQAGIGSSSALCVALCRALEAYKYSEKMYDKSDIAKIAIKIEREILQESGGIQDQIWAAYGGVNSIEIEKDGNFKVRPLHVSDEFLKLLRHRMVLAHIGNGRSSFELASAHDVESSVAIKQQIRRLADLTLQAFESESILDIGKTLHKGWMLKKSIATGISNENIDTVYQNALDNGAIGGKLLGAGGNGFMLFVLGDDTNRYDFIDKLQLENIEFDYSYGGAEVLLK